jgi:hypothetical protein
MNEFRHDWVFAPVDAARSVTCADRPAFRLRSLRLFVVGVAVAWVPLAVLVAFSLAGANSGGGFECGLGGSPR